MPFDSVMKRTLTLLTIVFAALLQATPSAAQNTRRDINVMEYVVIDQDTVYLDEIPPAGEK